jgi:hypothetical protein
MQKSPEHRWSALRLFAMHMTAVVVLTLTVPVTPSRAQASGYVRVKLVKAGLILGAGGGNGIVTYRGRDYPFRVFGLSLGFAAGVSVIRLTGWASGIRQIRDFAGTYSSVGGGGAFVGGMGGVQLTNGQGVRIALRGPRAGVELAGNIGQITISLKE